MSPRLAKVLLYGNRNKSVTVNLDATEGAQVGVNLLGPDGKLVKWNQILNPSTAAASSSIDTSDDLDEGAFNLYFTPRRAQDAVGAILKDSANVTFVYVGGTSITGDLTDLDDTGTGTLLATTFDAKGRKTGSRPATITGTDGHIAVRNGNASAGLPTIDLDASFLALIDFLQSIAPSPRITSDGSYRVTGAGDYRVTA